MAAKLVLIMATVVIAMAIAIFAYAKYVVPRWLDYKERRMEIEQEQERREQEQIDMLVDEAERSSSAETDNDP